MNVRCELLNVRSGFPVRGQVVRIVGVLLLHEIENDRQVVENERTKNTAPAVEAIDTVKFHIVRLLHHAYRRYMLTKYLRL